MPLFRIKKKLTIFVTSLLAGCSSPQPVPPVHCHDWTKAEKNAHADADLALSPENSLHEIIKDYIRVCRSLP
jgi:hypothetical protein